MRLGLALFHLATVVALAIGFSEIAPSQEPDMQEMNQDVYKRTEHGYYKRPTSYGHGGPSHPAPAYGHKAGYGSGYGYGPSYGRPPYYGGEYRKDDKSLDAIDKLYERLNRVQDEIKTGSEELANLETRLSLSKDFLDELNGDILPAARQKDLNQNGELANLMNALDDIMSGLNSIDQLVDNLTMANNENLADQQTADNDVAALRRMDIEQECKIASVHAKANDLKEKLFTVFDNEFQIVDDNTERAEEFLRVMKELEDSRKCEVGRVTLDADDRKAEYLFQSSFSIVPQISYSICGYNFDLNSREESYNYYHKEPNALGLLVTADATKTGVTIEAFDHSFGDTSLTTVDVCVEACSVGPGVIIKQRMDMM